MIKEKNRGNVSGHVNVYLYLDNNVTGDLSVCQYPPPLPFHSLCHLKPSCEVTLFALTALYSEMLPLFNMLQLKSWEEKGKTENLNAN